MKFQANQLILAVFSVLFLVQIQGSTRNDVCVSQTTCGGCIRVPNCVWCSKPNNSQCQLRTKNPEESCPGNYLVDPIPEFTAIGNKPLSKSEGKSESIILRPQSASLIKLRLGQPYNFTLQYKAVKDYSADLYYLMDVSLSMNDDKNSLTGLAGSLVDAMRNITSDFKIGFGSFVDKKVLPFVGSIDDDSPICGVGFECVTYSFINQLSFSDNVDKFTNAVNSTKIVDSNFDLPEGGFDALLQAVVCKEQIGWRDRSRRLIVFATDNYSHLAGNGRIGGILKPNDGKCHLDSGNHMYLEAENQDYPSLGQISRTAKENGINLIFAVTNQPLSSYQKFSEVISGSSVGELAGDSKNIVDLILTKYEKIISSVEMTHTAEAGMNVRYYTACTGTTVQERKRCENLKIEDVVNFTISIEATACPLKKAKSKQIINFNPIGMNETMTLEVEIICDCLCEIPGNDGYIANATECNHGGDLKCGSCDCDNSHSGTFCECSADTSSLDDSQCKADITTDVLCNNRGDCTCGNCVCHKRPNSLEVISGKHCECDNFSCARTNGNLCSNQGECKCGQCQCNSGWQGIDCNCETSNEKCIPFGGEDVCSGNGLCECGRCVCKSGAHGTFCQDCPTCPNKCDEFQPCVQCKIFQTGPYMNGTCNDVCTYSIIAEETVEVGPSERYCSYLNETNCKVTFVYGYDDTTGAKFVRVEREPVCPPPQSFLALGFGLLGGIVLAGLIALLAYRITTYVYDKREFARFEKERKNAKWNQENNPLYNDPTMTFKNPTYNT